MPQNKHKLPSSREIKCVQIQQRNMKQFQFLCGKHEGLTERILYQYHTSCKDLEVILYKSFTQPQQSMLIKVKNECIYAGTLHALAASLSSAEVQTFVVKNQGAMCMQVHSQID